MFHVLRVLVLTITAGTAFLASPASAAANWITIKNDTGKAIVLQETVVVKGEVRRGKAVNLLPGETFREFIPGPTTKRLEVFESQSPDRAAWSGNLDCKDDTQAFAVTSSVSKIAVVAVIPRRK